MSADALGGMSMQALFCVEVENQAQTLTDALLALETSPHAREHLDIGMRGAHSLKGAARIIGLQAAVTVAHWMEECLVAAQHGRPTLRKVHISLLLRGVDLLERIAQIPESQQTAWSGGTLAAEIDAYVVSLQQAMAEPAADDEAAAQPRLLASPALVTPDAAASPTVPVGGDDRVLRVSAEHLDRLLGLASESLVSSRWLAPFTDSLLRLKRMQLDGQRSIEQLLSSQPLDDHMRTQRREAQDRINACNRFLAERIDELESFARRASTLSKRLYDEALNSRMRPFSDGVAAFPRMVRDLGHTLGKQVSLTVVGQSTPVDRDILERLEAPLMHLLRNAVDHGIESPQERLAASKPVDAVIELQAHHSAGMLHISVSDDGRGIAKQPLRAKIVERGLAREETAARLSDEELLKFLFLPGFTMKEEVSEISGRGVGLDVVHHMVQQVRGSVHVETVPGRSTCFRLLLPLTLSLVRALLVEIGGQPFAFPLARLSRTLKLPKDSIEQLEGRQHVSVEGRQIGLVTAHQILQTPPPETAMDEFAVVVIGDTAHGYGVVVDRLLGEHELVVRPLDARLGKIKDIAAGALLEDGSLALIVDVDDMIQSMDKLAAAGSLDKAFPPTDTAAAQRRKRILVVDDSLTVRELERKLLDNKGYEVELAVDGMDGWNAVRTGDFDLVVTDVDMPRLDGIELVNLIKRHPRLESLPVLIVSYKDREDDRRRGLDAGADYYLTKGSFHDERLLSAVVDLIGEADQ